MNQKEVFKLVEKELESANRKFPLFNSSHEAYAVIKEELDEYWECVMKDRCKAEQRDELKQVAAMAIKAIVSLYAINVRHTK